MSWLVRVSNWEQYLSASMRGWMEALEVEMVRSSMYMEVKISGMVSRRLSRMVNSALMERTLMGQPW